MFLLRVLDDDRTAFTHNVLSFRPQRPGISRILGRSARGAVVRTVLLVVAERISQSAIAQPSPRPPPLIMSSPSDTRMHDDGGAVDARMHDSSSSSAAASASATAAAAAAAAASSAASSVPSVSDDWRPAVHAVYRSSTISATEPIAARRFDSLTHEQYLAGYASAAAASASAGGVHSASGIPIVIDNGAYDLRAGFCTDALPRLCFRSLVGRPRNRKEADYVLVGPELQEGDQYIPQRMRVRSAFESSVVTHWDLMEYALDFTFMQLGLRSSIPHPLMISEVMGCPNYCRAKMSELAFECYNLPAVGYFVQEAAVAHWNRLEDQRLNADGDVTGDALVVNVGFEATTALPIIDEKPAFDFAARLNLGGNHLTNHLTHSLLHITQTAHQSQLNSHRIGQIVEQYCEVLPESYDQTLQQMAQLWDVNQSAPPPGVTASSGIPPPVIFQLPFIAPVTAPVNASDLAAKQEKKEIQRQRLRSLMADRKAQKLADDQDTLADWVALRAELAAKSITPGEFLRQLKRRTFADEKDFMEHFERMKKSIEARLAGETNEEAAANAEAQAAERARKPDSELYPLLFRPDAELTAEELKEKQKQKRLKGAAEVQAARKREKDARLLAEKQAKDAEAAEFAADPSAFMAALHKQRDFILQSREDRIKAESESGGGRRTLAAKKRASLLAAMGGSGGSLEAIEKLSRKDRSAAAKEASFGMREEDWNVYDDVRMPGDAAARTESDDERENISKIEAKILSYDPTALSSTSAATSSDARVPVAEDFQFSLWVDRVRLPEMLWQPTAMLGVQEAGIGEMVQRALEALEPQVAGRVVRVSWEQSADKAAAMCAPELSPV